MGFVIFFQLGRRLCFVLARIRLAVYTVCPVYARQKSKSKALTWMNSDACWIAKEVDTEPIQ